MSDDLSQTMNRLAEIGVRTVIFDWNDGSTPAGSDTVGGWEAYAPGAGEISNLCRSHEEAAASLEQVVRAHLGKRWNGTDFV